MKKSNQILFEVKSQNPNDRESFFELAKNLRRVYKKEMSELTQRRDRLLKEYNKKALIGLIEDQKQLVSSIVRKTAKHFGALLSGEKLQIFWTGGIARGTNRLGGDFDLNFIFENPKLRVTEEQISLALSIIFGKPRDYIHSVLMREKGAGKIPNHGLFFVMRWDGDKATDYQYPISPGLEKLIYQGQKARRDQNYLLEKLCDNISEETCYDWLSTWETIIDDSTIKTIFDKVCTKEIEVYQSHEKFNELIERCRRKLQLQTQPSHLKVVSQIKERYKKIPFDNIFTLLALLRRRLLTDGAECKKVNLKELYNNSSIKKLLGKTAHETLFDGIYQYIWVVVRLEAIFEKMQIRFGVHNSQIVDEKFEKRYKSQCDDILEMYEYHEESLMRLNALLDKALNLIKYDLTTKSVYRVGAEYINIMGYSPFWFLNEVAAEYRYQSFNMPVMDVDGEKKPVHPHTLRDKLGNCHYKLVEEVEVFPTSSFRTLYEPKANICYKLPIFRQITRGLRDLPKTELQRSSKAGSEISRYKWLGFTALREHSHYHEDEKFNYITREMPNTPSVPWFYVISSQKFSKSFELDVSIRLIQSWMFYASKGIFLEYHTQNILVDEQTNTYYRDLSDVRSFHVKQLRPSYAELGLSSSDVMAVIFDRTLCKQNLDHLIRYSNKIKQSDKNMLKKVIQSEITKYDLNFPPYSFDFPAKQAVRIPVKEHLIDWRS